jgi:hypothetical protein
MMVEGVAHLCPPSLRPKRSNPSRSAKKELLRLARNDGVLTSATSSSVMAGLVPAIHVLRHLGMDLFETIAM